MNVDFFVKYLPDDIVRHIYEEYISIDFHYKIFMQLLNSRTSKNLNTSDIKPYIPYILSQPKLCNYMREHLVVYNGYKLFDSIYIEHKINKKKPFMRASNGGSIALSLLMNIYH